MQKAKFLVDYNLNRDLLYKLSLTQNNKKSRGK